LFNQSVKEKKSKPSYPRNVFHKNGQYTGIFLTAKILNNMWMVKTLEQLNFTLKCSDFLQNIISWKSFTDSNICQMAHTTWLSHICNYSQ